MSDGKRGGRFFERFLNVKLDRDAVTEGLTSIVAIGGIVAAAGAAVLLIGLATDLVDTSDGALGSAADPTGGRFFITDAHIQTDDAGRSVLREFIALGPGATPLDLSQMTIRLDDGDQNVTLSPANNTGNGSFTFQAIRDSNGSVAGPTTVMDSRDLVQIDVDLSANGMAPRGGTSLHHIQWHGDQDDAVETVLLVPTDVEAPSLVNLEVIP